MKNTQIGEKKKRIATDMLINLITGSVKKKKISVLMYVLAVLFVLKYAML